MATAAEGLISLSYRPLATMDELHVLLLAAVSTQATDPSLLEEMFSLPRNVVIKELAILEAYGLAQKENGRWTATSRGDRIIAVWNVFQNRSEAEVRTTRRQWLLGSGEFVVDEMIRDGNEIDVLARAFRVADQPSATKFLEQRRRAAERFEAFVLGWPSHNGADAAQGVFAEALAFDNLELAETDEALERLEELLATRIREVMDHCDAKQAAGVYADGEEEAANARALIRMNGEEVMKRFKEARRTQRRQNQHLARVKAVCEALLAGRWLSATVGSLEDVFRTEPAAFVFRSTVPLVEPEEEGRLGRAGFHGVSGRGFGAAARRAKAKCQNSGADLTGFHLQKVSESMKLTFGVNDGELFVRSVEFGHPQELRFLQRVTLRYRVFEGVLVVSLCASYGNLECLLFSPMTGKEIVADLGKAERKALGIEEVVVVDAQMFEKLVDAAEAEAEQAKLPSGAAPSGGKKPGGKKPAPPAAAEEEDDEDAELEAEEVEGADGEKEDDEWEEVDDDDLEYEDEEEE